MLARPKLRLNNPAVDPWEPKVPVAAPAAPEGFDQVPSINADNERTRDTSVDIVPGCLSIPVEGRSGGEENGRTGRLDSCEGVTNASNHSPAHTCRSDAGGECP